MDSNLFFSSLTYVGGFSFHSCAINLQFCESKIAETQIKTLETIITINKTYAIASANEIPSGILFDVIIATMPILYTIPTTIEHIKIGTRRISGIIKSVIMRAVGKVNLIFLSFF